MSPWAQGSGRAPLVLSLLKQWRPRGQTVSICHFSFALQMLWPTLIPWHFWSLNSQSTFCDTTHPCICCSNLLIKPHIPVFLGYLWKCQVTDVQIQQLKSYYLLPIMGETTGENSVYNLLENYIFTCHLICKRGESLTTTTTKPHMEPSTKLYSIHSIFSLSPVPSLSHRKWGKLEGTFTKTKSVKIILVSSQCQQRKYLLCFHFQCVA